MGVKENKNVKLKESEKHIKYVVFDLSTEELKKHFPNELFNIIHRYDDRKLRIHQTFLKIAFTNAKL